MKSLKNISILYSFVLFVTLFSSFAYATDYQSGEHDFYLINPEDTRNIIGNTQIIGNTVECVTEKTSATEDDYNSNYANFSCTDDLEKNDNNYIVKYIDIDDEDTTFNSSTATLQLPETYKEVAWAGLFWQGNINSKSYIYSDSSHHYTYYKYSDDDYSGDVEDTDANKIKLKIGNNQYIDIEASILNYVQDDNEVQYSAFADITSYLQNIDTSAQQNLDITIANISASQGIENSIGNFGAWTLVVIYKENEDALASKLRNNSVYFGYKYITSNHPDSITIDDFILPRNGTIDSQLAVFAGEGEYRYDPDYMELDGINLGDPDTDNVFDARLSDSIMRNPSLLNNNGIDIDVFDTSAIMTQKRDDDPDASSYSSTISLSTDNDIYFPSMVSFTTELYKPRVCYYIDKITDEDNRIIYENKNFTDDIVQNKKYKISMWIANMKKDPTDTDIETAKKVKVSLNYQNFDYSDESTYIMNIGENNFSHITDNINDDIGEFLNDFNQSDWRVGSGASSSEGGTLLPTFDFNDNTNKVFVDFNGTFNIENNTTEINLDDIFNFKAAYATDYFEITNPVPIPKCQDFSTIGSTYIPNLGSFNVVESSFNSSIDPTDINNSLNKIETKVVNKEETLKVLSLDENFETLNNYRGIVEVDLIKNPIASEIECQTNPTLSEFFATFTNISSTQFIFKHNKILPDGRFRIRYLTDEDGNLIDSTACTAKTYNCVWGLLTQIATDRYGNSCPTGTTFVNDNNNDTYCDVKCAMECNYYRERNQGDDQVPSDICLECLFGNYSRSVCSRDNFAIRPDRFNITNIPTNIKAGEDFNITIQALGFDNQPALDYNKTINTTTLVSPKFDYNDTNSTNGCITGTLSTIGSLSFQNGEANITLNYNEVGDLNISIKELVGSEFAIVDNSTNDTTDDDRLITKGFKTISIVPDHFSLSANFKNFDNNFTYLSSDINNSMAAILDINVTAQNANNQPTRNYNSACYAKKSDYNITYTPLVIQGLTKVLYQEENSSITGNTLMTNSNFIITNIPKDLFTTDNNGTANIKIKINFDRNDSVAVNPFEFTLNDVNMSDEDNITGSINIDKNATFYYGRSHAPDQRIEGITGNASIYYEVYCKDCNKTKYNIIGKESIDSINWYINTQHTSATQGTFYQTNPTSIDGTTINTIFLKSIVLTAPKVPHRDKITLHSNSWLVYNPIDFLVEFYDGATNWAGRGKLGEVTDKNISKRSNRRIDW